MTSPTPASLWVLRIRDHYVGPLTEFQARSMRDDLLKAGTPAHVQALRLTPVNQIHTVLRPLAKPRTRRGR